MLLCLLLVLSGSQAAAQEGPRAPNGYAPWPDKWDPRNRDPYLNAVQVWRLGADFFIPRAWPERRSLEDNAPFQGIDPTTGRFLTFPELQPVVQFSDARTTTPYEDSLVEALENGSPELKLQALAILLRVRAPSSVPQQWKALSELRKVTDRPHWQPLIFEWVNCFDPTQVEQELSWQSPEGARFVSDSHYWLRTYLWSVRAAGVTHNRKLLYRLTELSRSDRLYTSLAAERSLEDFTGPQADQALANCLLGWRYNAYVHAGYALAERNKPLLVKTLLDVKPPADCRYYQGIFLAHCDHPAAVPILCQEVRHYQIIDGRMFDFIARLGRPEHRAMIEALPSQVRPDQRETAERTVQKYLKRIN